MTWKCELCRKSIWWRMVVIGVGGMYYKFHKKCLRQTTREKWLYVWREELR